MKYAGGRTGRPVALFHVFEKFVEGNISVTQRAAQGVAIHFVMEREDDHSAVRMRHFHVAAAPVNFHEAKPLQSSKHLPARKERKFHSEISTTSSAADGARSLEEGSK